MSKNNSEHDYSNDAKEDFVIVKARRSAAGMSSNKGIRILFSALVFVLAFAVLYEPQAEATSLDTNVDELDFGNVQLNSNARRTLTFIIENDQRRNNNLRDVNIGSVTTEARINSNCDDIRVSPTRVDIPQGGTAAIEVTLQNVSNPGPLLCSVTIDSTELFSGSSSSRNRSSCGGITSARICVEIKANVTAPILTLEDFEVDRTTRTGSRNNNNDTVNVTQTGSGSNTNLTADFGSLDVFEEAEVTITIGNVGDATLQVNVRGSGNNDVAFRGAIGDNVTIAPGDEREIDVFIRPVDGGSFTATLTISPTGQSSGSSSQRITIRFTGNSNSVDVTSSSTFVTFEARVDDVTSASAQVANENAETDGKVIAQQSNDRDEESITIRNNGEGDDLSSVEVTMTIEHIRSTGRSGSRSNRDVFRFEGTDDSNDDLVFTLNANQSQQVTIIYEPTTVGIDEAVIEVEVRLLDIDNRRSSSVIQSFFINLRGIAVASNTNTASAGSSFERLKLSQTGLQQLSSSSFKFEAQGTGIAGIQAEVFNLSGQNVYNSGIVAGNTIHWRQNSNNAAQLANGVYFYRLVVTGKDGTEEHVELRKFVLMR